MTSTDAMNALCQLANNSDNGRVITTSNVDSALIDELLRDGYLSRMGGDLYLTAQGEQAAANW